MFSMSDFCVRQVMYKPNSLNKALEDITLKSHKNKDAVNINTHLSNNIAKLVILIKQKL